MEKTYEQGLLDGAKLMFKMFKDSIIQLEKNLFDDVKTFKDVERKIQNKGGK